MQYDFGSIDPTTTSGSDLSDALVAFRNALESCHKGLSRPAYAQAGLIWIQEVSGSNWPLLMFDGTSDIQFGTFDTVAHAFHLSSSGSIAGNRIGGGLGSDLDLDTIQGQALANLVRKDTSSDLATGVVWKLKYTTTLDSADGKIGARIAAPGLNIYGIASEGDGVRHVTAFGTWQHNGSLTAYGTQVQSGSYLAASSGQPILASQFRFYETSNDTGFDWVGEGVAQFTSNGARKLLFNNAGGIQSAAYGWLGDVFAVGAPTGGMGAPHVSGVCGSSPTPLDYGVEAYNAGGNSIGLRNYFVNCTDCGAGANCTGFGGGGACGGGACAGACACDGSSACACGDGACACDSGACACACACEGGGGACDAGSY